MAEYVCVPQNLTEKILITEYGTDAVRFYKSRLEERKRHGKIYPNPLKTIYIWAAQDKKTNQGFYTTWNGFAKRKHKNHGGS